MVSKAVMYFSQSLIRVQILRCKRRFRLMVLRALRVAGRVSWWRLDGAWISLAWWSYSTCPRNHNQLHFVGLGDKSYLPVTCPRCGGTSNHRWLNPLNHKSMNTYYVKSHSGANDWIIDAEDIESAGEVIRFLGEKGEVIHEVAADDVHEIESNNTIRN